MSLKIHMERDPVLVYYLDMKQYIQGENPRKLAGPLKKRFLQLWHTKDV